MGVGASGMLVCSVSQPGCQSHGCVQFVSLSSNTLVTCTLFYKDTVFELKVVNWRKKHPEWVLTKCCFLTFLLSAVNVHILKLWKNIIMNYRLEHFSKCPEMPFDTMPELI